MKGKRYIAIQARSQVFRRGGIKIVFTYFEQDFLKILLNVSRFIPVHLFDIEYNFSQEENRKKT